MFLGLFEQLLFNSEHEHAWHIDDVEDHSWKVRHVYDLILEWEDKTLNSFTAVDETGRAFALEEIARVKQDSLEKPHHIIDSKGVK